MTERNYTPIPDPMGINDPQLRSLLIPIIDNLRLLAGMGPYASDPRRATREGSATSTLALLKKIDAVKLDQILAIASSISSTQKSLDAIITRVDTAESEIDTLQTNLTTAEGEIDTLQTDVSGHETRLDNLYDPDATPSPTGLVQTNIDDIADHETRITTLEGFHP